MKLMSYVRHKLITLVSRKHHTDRTGTKIRSDHKTSPNLNPNPDPNCQP